jgi:hypothetical protein
VPSFIKIRQFIQKLSDVIKPLKLSSIFVCNARAKFHKNPSVYTEGIGCDKTTSVMSYNRIYAHTTRSVWRHKYARCCTDTGKRLSWGWRHSSRNLMAILPVIQHASDVKQLSTWIKHDSLPITRNLKTQKGRQLTQPTDLIARLELPSGTRSWNKCFRQDLTPRTLQAARNGRS